MLKNSFQNLPIAANLAEYWSTGRSIGHSKNMTVGSRSTDRSTMFNRDQMTYSQPTAWSTAIEDRSNGRSTGNVHNVHTLIARGSVDRAVDCSGL